MKDERLALIPLRDIPDKGGARYTRRDARMKGHMGDAVLTGFVGSVFATGAILLTIFGFTVVPPSSWLFAFVTFAFAAVSAGMSGKFLKETLKDFRNYLDEKDPQSCLPAGSCPEDAEFESSLTEAAKEYNAAAQEWNAYAVSEEGMLPNAGNLKRELLRRRDRIEQGIRFLREGRTLETLPEPERPLSQKKLTGRALIGPSSLIK